MASKENKKTDKKANTKEKAKEKAKINQKLQSSHSVKNLDQKKTIGTSNSSGSRNNTDSDCVCPTAMWGGGEYVSGDQIAFTSDGLAIKLPPCCLKKNKKSTPGADCSDRNKSCQACTMVSTCYWDFKDKQCVDALKVPDYSHYTTQCEGVYNGQPEIFNDQRSHHGEHPTANKEIYSVKPQVESRQADRQPSLFTPASEWHHYSMWEPVNNNNDNSFGQSDWREERRKREARPVFEIGRQHASYMQTLTPNEATNRQMMQDYYGAYSPKSYSRSYSSYYN